MKRQGFIYELIVDKENIRRALHNASRKKKNKRVVRKILNNEDFYINEIHKMLSNESYIPSPYKEFRMVDILNKKVRVMHKPKFYPDQIIHWCLMQQIDHLLMRGMYKWSCASIPGRGTHYAMRGIRKWLRTDKKRTKYCIKLDITQYYASVDNELLKSKFRKIIKCQRTLNLIDKIVDSLDKGLPIGNYTSQWFANFYLQEIDHYIKQELQVPYYMRYMDDLVLLSGNKRKLRKAFNELILKLKEHNVEVKNNYQFFEIEKRSLSFVGFVFNHEKVFVRKRITLRSKRKVSIFRKKPSLKLAQAIVSYYGWYKHSNSYVLEKKYFKNKDNILLKAKEIIRNESRKINESFARYAT